MRCVTCGNLIDIDRNSNKYCSVRCSKNYLKREYRRRKREVVSDYNRRYRAAMLLRPLSWEKRMSKISTSGGVCQRCGTSDNLNVHHIKPLIANGTNSSDNLIVLCFSCHMSWEKRMSDYWDKNHIELSNLRTSTHRIKKIDKNWWKDPVLRQRKINELIG